ncbi:MAG TPA: hypothetical protein VJZ91_01270 [Blastocatellia bacterium]|nr:hypothetical protein [Blastocatellia bacterium]
MPDAYTVVDPAIPQAELPAHPGQTEIIIAPVRVRATRMLPSGTKPDLPRRPRRLCCAASFSLPSAIFYDELADVKADEYRRLQRMNAAGFNSLHDHRLWRA